MTFQLNSNLNHIIIIWPWLILHFSNHCQLVPLFFSSSLFSLSLFTFLFLPLSIDLPLSLSKNLLTKREKWHLSFPSLCCFFSSITLFYPSLPTLKVCPTTSFLSLFFCFSIVYGQFGFSKLNKNWGNLCLKLLCVDHLLFCFVSIVWFSFPFLSYSCFEKENTSI